MQSYQFNSLPQGLYLNDYDQALFPKGAIALRLAQSYMFEEHKEVAASERWQIHLRSYSYALEQRGDDRSEIVNFHWDAQSKEHRQGRTVIFPHVHIGTGELAHRSFDRTTHIPTGLVRIEDVIELGIGEFDGGSAVDMPDSYDSANPRWMRVLADARVKSRQLIHSSAAVPG